MKKLVRLASWSAFALALAACADEEQSGNLTILYELGFDQSTCGEVGVTQVRANFNDISETETCNDEGEFTASGLPARTYDFLFEGIDAEGVTIYDSLGDADADRVTVVGGSTQMVEVALSPTPAQIQVSFNLLDEDGFGYTGQAESPVTEFEVIALDGNSAMHEHTFVVAQLDGPRDNIVPDEGRDINGENLDGVRINATVNGSSDPIDFDGEAVFRIDPPGHGRLVDILVECRAEVCTGTFQGLEEADLTAGGESGSGTGAVDGTG